MSKILFYDVETSGLDTKKDEIWEIAWVITDIKLTILHVESHLLTIKTPLSKEVQDLCKMDNESIDTFGKDPKSIFAKFVKDYYWYKVTYIAGHNIKKYDNLILQSNMERYGFKELEEFFKNAMYIDTMNDLPYEYPTKKLSYLAAEHGFLNPFAHRALFDVATTVRILQGYDMEKVLEIAESPDVEIRAMVSFENKDKASKRGFRWDPERKIWFKQTKQIYVEKESNHMDFAVKII